VNRGNGFPFVAALGVTMLVGFVVERILGGLKVGRDTAFLIFGALFAGAFTFYLVRRLINGPDLERDEWILLRPVATRPEALSVAALTERLVKYGYAPTFSSPELWQQKVTVTDPKLGKGELRFEIGVATPPFFGTVEIDDNPHAKYGDFATCFLFELGELIGDVTFKRTYSTLPEESTKELRALLPGEPAAPPS
jgi:hypothetical protein